jgi:hypothetical protein
MGKKISELTTMPADTLVDGDWFVVVDLSENDTRKISSANILDNHTSSFGRTLIDDANASAFLTTLGVDTDILTLSLPANVTISAFLTTILDDADASAVLTTMGVDTDLLTLALPANTTISAFAKTILDDANAAAVLATLGFVSSSAGAADAGKGLVLDAGGLIDASFIEDADIDHGGIGGLSDDDHPQYIKHDLAVAANDFLVASGIGVFVKKTLAETGAILEGDIDHGNLQGIADDDHTIYPLVTDFEVDRATIQTNWTDLTDGGETALHSHSGSGLAAGAIPGFAQRAKFIYSTAANVLVNAGVYHHQGTSEQIVYWDSQLTVTITASTGWNYLYLDDSAIVTAGTNLLTASELIFSTTAPTWSDSKHGWYNGNDRCIFATYASSANTQLEFFHNRDFVQFANNVNARSISDLDTTWTDVTLRLPGFCREGQASFEWGNAASNQGARCMVRVNGQSGTVGHGILHGIAIAADFGVDVLRVITDSTQKIECKMSVSNNCTLGVDTMGWVFPEGM